MKAVQKKIDEGRNNKSLNRNDELPSRKEFHLTKKKTRKKKQRPFLLIRTLLIFFVFIVIGAFSYFYFGLGSELEKFGKELTSREETAYEEFEYEIGNKSKKSVDETNKQQEKEPETIVSEPEKENSNDEVENQQEIEKSDQSKEMNGYEEGGSKEPLLTNKSNEEGYEITHIVQKGETLFRLSMKYYNNRDGEAIIRERNELKENEIYEGQKLIIPLQ
jgi:LysM repeat protein